MPYTDLPLAELERYQGTNPRPGDFTDYWERAISELQRVETDVEHAPAPFRVPFADCFDLYFNGVGGARIHAKLLKPHQAAAQSGSAPALLQFHGYSMNSGTWYDKLGYAAAGFVVAALDCRGQGGYSEDPSSVRGNTLRGHIIRGVDDVPEKLLYRQIFLDTVQLAWIVMGLEEVDPDRVAVMGASQGGALAIACAALEPRIRKAVPIFPFLSDYRRAWQLDPDRTAYLELKEYFRRFDPTHAHEAELFTKLGYVDVQHLADRIRADVLMATGLSDDVCPPSTQFAAYNRISSPKRMVVYPDFGHEELPGFADSAFAFVSELLDAKRGTDDGPRHA